MEDEKEIEITWNKEPTKVTVRALTFTEVDQIRKKAATIRAIGRVTQTDFDTAAYNQEMIFKGLKEAQFEINIPNITKFSYRDGLAILTEITMLTGLNEDEKKTLSGKPEEENTSDS